MLKTMAAAFLPEVSWVASTPSPQTASAGRASNVQSR